MKVYIATSRPIGEECRRWAHWNLPPGFEWGSMDDCDIFISVLYDKIVPAEFIAGKKCFNFHPGLLPQYRGAGAFSWVLINGEKHTGVTLHEIDKDIDHGAIITRGMFEILPEHTAEDLFNLAMAQILTMFKFWFKLIITNDYGKRRFPINRKIYLRKDLEEAKDLTRFVKALTFKGKENAYFINARGEKKYLDYYA